MNSTSEDFVRFQRELVEEAGELFEEANREYSDDDQWTSNFDFVTLFMRMGGHEEFRPRDAAFTYLMKSVFSISRGHSTRQSMRSRYLDAMNYLSFMAWMDDNDHDVEVKVRGSYEDDGPLRKEEMATVDDAMVVLADSMERKAYIAVERLVNEKLGLECVFGEPDVEAPYEGEPPYTGEERAAKATTRIENGMDVEPRRKHWQVKLQEADGRLRQHLGEREEVDPREYEGGWRHITGKEDDGIALRGTAHSFVRHCAPGDPGWADYVDAHKAWFFCSPDAGAMKWRRQLMEKYALDVINDRSHGWWMREVRSYLEKTVLDPNAIRMPVAEEERGVV